MSGIYGVASKENCTEQLFYGVDYQSHLGTAYGGLAVLGDTFERQIHDVSQSQFKSKFIEDIGRLNGNKGIGVVSDYDLITNNPKRKLSPQEALEEMGMERGKLYDSIVLRTLSQVAEAQARARRRPEREIMQKARLLEEEGLKESFEDIFREEE